MPTLLESQFQIPDTRLRARQQIRIEVPVFETGAMPENRWISNLHWRRAGQYARSERTQNASLDAAEALILEHGTENVSVNDIAKVAGSLVGSLYHHFKDKTALYYVLFHRMTETFAAVSRDTVRPERWEDASVLDILRGFVGFSLASTKERPALKAAALLVAGERPDLHAHYAELQAEMCQGVSTLLLARRDEIGHPDPDRAIAFVLNQLGAMIRARLDDVWRSAQLEPGPDEVFIEDALTSASLFLQLKPKEGE